MENTNDLILNFIKQYRDLGAENCFSNGMCYWFAHILQHRFKDIYPANIVYASLENHFGCMLGDCVYDITGDVSNKYNWILWDIYELKDRQETNRIYRDCIFKLPLNVKICGTCRNSRLDDCGNTICAIDNAAVSFNIFCNKEEKYVPQ